MPSKRVLAVLVACLLAVVAAAPTSAAASAPPDSSLTGLHYVALGDSYSAGYGIPPASGLPVPGCAQSSVDYPHLLAAQFGLVLTDVSCAGALATNVMTPQVTSSGTAPPQQTALGPDTDIVTVTLGGNDLDFAGVARFCTALSATGPVLGGNSYSGADCKGYYDPPGGPDMLADNIATVVIPHVRAALAAIAAAAPRAKVFVVGYPSLTPDAAHTPVGGCFRTIDNGGNPAPTGSRSPTSTCPTCMVWSSSSTPRSRRRPQPRASPSSRRSRRRWGTRRA